MLAVGVPFWILIIAVSYYLAGGVLFFVIASVVTPSTWLISKILRSSQPAQIAQRVFLYLLFVFAFGVFGQLGFVAFLEKRWYTAPDPIIDFFPFFPSIELASGGGHLIGGKTPLDFYVAWSLTTVATWLVATAAFRKMWYWPLRETSVTPSGLRASETLKKSDVDGAAERRHRLDFLG